MFKFKFFFTILCRPYYIFQFETINVTIWYILVYLIQIYCLNIFIFQFIHLFPKMECYITKYIVGFYNTQLFIDFIQEPLVKMKADYGLYNKTFIMDNCSIHKNSYIKDFLDVKWTSFDIHPTTYSSLKSHWGRSKLNKPIVRRARNSWIAFNQSSKK